MKKGGGKDAPSERFLIMPFHLCNGCIEYTTGVVCKTFDDNQNFKKKRKNSC